MIGDINLFVTKIGKIRKKQQLKQLGLRGLTVLVLAAAAAMVSLAGYNLILSKQSQQLSKKIDMNIRRIEELRGVESKQVYLLSKLKSFETVLNSQERHQAIAETVFSILPAGTALDGFTIGEDGTIILTGSVPGFEWLNQILASVRLSQTRLPIVKAQMEKVSYGKDGFIGFSLNLILGGS